MNFKRNEIKKAFTMAELIIVLGIVGVVAAITLPTLINNLPDRNDAIRKKVEYELEHKIAELYNDDILYGDRKQKVTITENGESKTITFLSRGFRNTYYVKVNGEPYGKDPDDPDKLYDLKFANDNNGEKKAQAQQKFCKLLASRFDIIETEPNCSDDANFSSDTNNNKPTFTTRDGIEWVLEITNFADENGDDKPAALAFKVSADRKLQKNCAWKPEDKIDDTTDVNKAIASFVSSGKKNITYDKNCKRPDIFLYAVNANGTLYKPYVRSAKVLTRQ